MLWWTVSMRGIYSSTGIQTHTAAACGAAAPLQAQYPRRLLHYGPLSSFRSHCRVFPCEQQQLLHCYSELKGWLTPEKLWLRDLKYSCYLFYVASWVNTGGHRVLLLVFQTRQGHTVSICMHIPCSAWSQTDDVILLGVSGKPSSLAWQGIILFQIWPGSDCPAGDLPAEMLKLYFWRNVFRYWPTTWTQTFLSFSPHNVTFPPSF